MTPDNKHPLHEGEIPEELPIPIEIENWFTKNSASYETLHPTKGMGRSIFEDGAYLMYQKLQPEINSLTKEKEQLTAQLEQKSEDQAILWDEVWEMIDTGIYLSEKETSLQSLKAEYFISRK